MSNRMSAKQFMTELDKKPAKYKNRKTQMLGLTFDSRAEAARYAQLVILERTGQIKGLERQVAYEICPAVKFEGAKRITPARKYVCDFAYWEGDKHIVEDVKSPATASLPVFTLKRQLMKAVLGIEIRLTGNGRDAA